MKLLNLYPECSFPEVYIYVFLTCRCTKTFETLKAIDNVTVRGFVYPVKVVYLSRTFPRTCHGLQ